MNANVKSFKEFYLNKKYPNTYGWGQGMPIGLVANQIAEALAEYIDLRLAEIEKKALNGKKAR